MKLLDIKEQIIDQVTTQWNRFQESSIYIQMRERYDNLTSTQQRLAFAGGVIVVMLIVFSVPISYIQSSATEVARFNSYRELTRDLLRVTRAQDVPPVERISASMLRTRIEEELKVFRLQKDQIVKIEEMNPNLVTQYRVAPPQIQEEGVQVVLGQLNLKQIVDISHRIATIGETVKLAGLSIAASAKNNHYFDVTMQVSSFAAPEKKEDNSKGKKSRPRSGDE